MTVSYRTGITIFQFIFFLPSFGLALFLCVHHGVKAAGGTWRLIATLSALRVAGDISYFISLSHPSLSVYIAVIVCELSGLAPLVLVCVALVGRVNKISHSFPPKSFILIFVLSIVGLIIGIVGTDRALEDASTINDIHTSGLGKGALALFLVCYGLMLFSFLYVVFDITRHSAKRIALGTETRTLIIIGLACPFLFVRLLYSALGGYSGNPIYSSVYGNNTIYLCMGVLMEIIATTICLSSAFLVPMPKEEKMKQISGSQNTAAETIPSPATQRTSHDTQYIPLAARQ